MRRHPAPTRTPRPLAWGALVTVYVLWGSTYLAIRVGVRDLPPMTMAGLRYLTAGAVLYPIATRIGGGPSAGGASTHRPGRRQWWGAALVGTLLLVLGNGGVSIGEQRLDSGFAAVLVATVPLWMVLFAWPIDGNRPTRRSLGGLGVGLIGVAVLAGADAGSGQLTDVVVVLGAACAWGLGSVLAHRLALPRRALVAAAMEMIVGGVVLLLVAAVRGEYGRIQWSHVPATGWLALLYLIGPGSLLGFTAYGYALARLPLATVSTYAYVNPVVAVVLGVAILGEPLTAYEVAGTVLVVASVVLTIRRPTTGRPASAQPVLAPPLRPANYRDVTGQVCSLSSRTHPAPRRSHEPPPPDIVRVARAERPDRIGADRLL
jgi:drug/metabolite transporter (DMT)-like permease